MSLIYTSSSSFSSPFSSSFSSSSSHCYRYYLDQDTRGQYNSTSMGILNNSIGSRLN